MIPTEYHKFLAPGKSHNPEFNPNRKTTFNDLTFLYIESNQSSILNGKEIKSLISRTGGIVQLCNSQDVERGSTMLLSRDTIYIAQEDDVENLPAISRFLKANKVNFVVELIHIFYAIISADVRSALNVIF
uniref:BRCT domain-containing protein n=2 Tax=Hanusia phi TaxID=3032 RepID=A0A7S0ERX0_9CRYP|mmetsp:Transcript_29865/g.67552  ORF Transcript_29865/g.67552 Transcript_29865/m.67552 type:complete len:131 (+) Transcript_29865:735-1127(+)